jgi:hypothetical protein
MSHNNGTLDVTYLMREICSKVIRVNILSVVFLAFIVAGLAGSYGCGEVHHKTLLLYEYPDERQLPPDSVASISFEEARPYGIGIARFDDRVGGIGKHDVVVVLPGRHRMWLSLKRSDPISKRHETIHADLAPDNYVLLEFDAKQGHQYIVKVLGFIQPNWMAELRDLSNQEYRLRGRLTVNLD